MNRTTSHLYESSNQIWQNAKAGYLTSKQREQPDFTILTGAENNIRKNSLQILFEIAAAYGNKEVFRIKNSNRSVGPLNQRFNIGGAVLRNFVMTQFPFPDREPLLDSVGDVYGYPSNYLCHKVVPIHSLPELDFIDCCRKHIQVLNTWCYIFDVSSTDTFRYSNWFLQRARPYLEYIYSEHKYGESGFRDNTVKILREIKNDIAGHYRVRVGDVPTVISSLEDDRPEFGLDFFRKQVDEARSKGIIWSAIDELDRILKGGSIVASVQEKRYDGTQVDRPAPCLTESDVEHFWTRLLELSGQRGSQVHRQITSLFPSFWSLERAIRFGDESGGEDGYMVGSEIPLETNLGKGRVDLVLFRREITPDGLDVFWTPVLVVDIKTKLGFSWDLSHEVKKSKARTRHGLPLRKVPDFKIEYRSLDEEEWRSIIEANPTRNTVEQVNAYADAVSSVYQQIIQRDDSEPVLRAALLMDASDDIRKIQSLIRSFLIEVYELAVHFQDRIPRTVFRISVSGDKSNVALILHEQEGYFEYETESIPAPMKLVQDPFEKTTAEIRKFILYLAGASPVSGGPSAAWIAKYYHGLHLLSELAEEIENPQILWIDMANEFTQPHLRTARLRLQPYSSKEKDVFRSQPSYIGHLFDSIEIQGMKTDVYDFLFNDGKIPEIRSESKPNLIIVSGWDTVNESTPSPHREKLRVLLAGLLDQLPNDTDITTVWFDSPVPGQENSSVYSTRTLLPFYQDSPIFEEVTEIVWNLPTAPESEILAEQWSLPVIGTTPLYDDIRVIIQQKRTGFDIELTNIPPLMGWSKKFRSKFPEKNLDLLLQDSSPDIHTRIRIKLLALDLVPHLLSLWPQATIEIDNLEKLVHNAFNEIKFPYQFSREEITVTSEKLDEERKKELNLLQRARFRPWGPKGRKAYVPIAVGTINSQRFYRSPYRLQMKRKPSFEAHESVSDIPSPILAFGRFFMRSDGEIQDELLVVEDVHDRNRLLAGLFTENSKQDQAGFIWTAIDTDRWQQVFNESLDSFASEDILIASREDKQEFWKYDPDSQDWIPGASIEIVAEKRGRISSINAIRISPLLSAMQPFSIDSIPESFNQRIKLMLEKLINEKRALKWVKATIRDVKTGCEIRFLDETNDEVVHSIGVEGTPDLIRVLRQPLSIKGPLRTGKGESIIWNPFTDISYGNLESIRPFVETGAPRDVGRSLIPRIDGFAEPREEISLSLVLIHDSAACPIVAGEGTVHDVCWRVTPTNEDSFIEKYRKPMTGREIYGHLAPGKIETKNATYSIELLLSHEADTREFYVYHEDNWIRRLLREKDMYLEKLVPGTFLRENEKWIVTFIVKDNDVEWMGVSTVSNLRWKNNVFRIKLDSRLNLEEAQNDFFSRISEEIPLIFVANLDTVKKQIHKLFLKRGYGKKGPPCNLIVSREGTMLTIILTQIYGADEITISRNSFRVNKNERKEDIMSDFYYQLEEGDLSNYNIQNETEFLEYLDSLLREAVVN